MSNFLMLVICLVAGMLRRRAGRVGDNAHQALNAVIVHLALPAVTLRTLHAFGMPTRSRSTWATSWCWRRP